MQCLAKSISNQGHPLHGRCVSVPFDSDASCPGACGGTIGTVYMHSFTHSKPRMSLARLHNTFCQAQHRQFLSPVQVWEAMRQHGKDLPLTHLTTVIPANVSVGGNGVETIMRLRALTMRSDIDARDSFFLVLLYTTGLRIHAVAQLRVSDVWDTVGQKPHSWFCVKEKNSKLRTIVRWCVSVIASTHQSTTPPMRSCNSD